MKQVFVAGKVLELTALSKSELKGVFIDAVLGYEFYKTAFNDNDLCLLVPKREKKLAPLQYKQLADKLQTILSLPIVFLFDRLEYYERNRLIDRGVFFVISKKYTYLPFLIINAKQTDKMPLKTLTPAAQYLLLFHLQTDSLQGQTINEIEKQVPYKYVTLTRAVACLEQFKICTSEKDVDRQKRIYFDDIPNVLWSKIQNIINSPLKVIYYCDEIITCRLPICGINALAHCSNLNPENSEMYAVDEGQLKELLKEKAFKNLNRIEGNIKIEVWKYPPISKDSFVDKLSLYLTLKEDKDPRIEKELELMIDKLWL
jgi:hypothetical protein